MQIGMSVYCIHLGKVSNPHSIEFVIVCTILALFIEVIFISDILLSRMQNKIFWIISILIFSGIGGIIYLIKRNKLQNQSRVLI